MREPVRHAVRRNPATYRLAQRLRFVGLAALDAVEAAAGRRDELLPPRRYRLVGRGDFAAVGRGFVAEVVDLGALGPADAVLDIGCGAGRMAIPLLDRLGPEGRYRGFDIVPQWVRWCSEHVAPRHPGFEFTLADVGNRKYNPSGRSEASTFRFPYRSGTFDVAFAASVFTHLLRADLDNYLREAARVLVPGGRLLATFYLLDERSRERMRAGATAVAFDHRRDGAFVTDPSVPELVVAYEEEAVRSLFAEHGLEILEPIRHGSWAGAGERAGRQDLVVARRAA